MGKLDENIEIAKLALQMLHTAEKLSPEQGEYIGLDPLIYPRTGQLEAFEILYRHLKTVLTEE
ncbi:hypothetical protein [Providencia manganoxydans]|uniref:hypothetical protein n=1 Tax=Providencia manganoxydans TaxID=2923283 RepID=UPI0034E3A61D